MRRDGATTAAHTVKACGSSEVVMEGIDEVREYNMILYKNKENQSIRIFYY
jgi:hypothetical protein